MACLFMLIFNFVYYSRIFYTFQEIFENFSKFIAIGVRIMELVEKIQQLCNQNNTTVTQLERDLGFSKGSIRKWDTSSPSSDKLMQVATHFNITMEYLLDKKSYDESVPFLLVQKLTLKTTDSSLIWKPIKNMVKPLNYFDFSLNEYFDDDTPRIYSIDRSQSFFAPYKAGGYLLVQISINPDAEFFADDTLSRRFLLFIYNKDLFVLYANDSVLPALRDLMKKVVVQNLGIDTFINDFLSNNE